MRNSIFTIICILFCSLAIAQDRSADEKLLKKLSSDWMVATMKRDQNTLNKIVAPEFKLAGTDLTNPGISREIWMENTMKNLKIDSINYNKIRVDVIGDVAIVQSNFYWSVAYMNSAPKKDTVNLVDTWIRREQGWQVVSRLVVN